MPKVPQPKATFKGKKKIITIVGVVLLILLAAGAGIFLRWQQNQNPASQNGDNGSNNPTGNPELDGLAQNPLPDSVKDAQDLASTGNVEESNKQLGVSIANTTNNDEKYELYIQQAINNENSQKWDDALTSYKSAEAIKKTSTVYIGMGRAYEGKGDKQAAINAYKAALPLLDTSDPMHNFDKKQLEDKIKALGG